MKNFEEGQIVGLSLPADFTQPAVGELQARVARVIFSANNNSQQQGTKSLMDLADNHGNWAARHCMSRLGTWMSELDTDALSAKDTERVQAYLNPYQGWWYVKIPHDKHGYGVIVHAIEMLDIDALVNEGACPHDFGVDNACDFDHTIVNPGQRREEELRKAWEKVQKQADREVDVY